MLKFLKIGETGTSLEFVQNSQGLNLDWTSEINNVFSSFTIFNID